MTAKACARLQSLRESDSLYRAILKLRKLGFRVRRDGDSGHRTLGETFDNDGLKELAASMEDLSCPRLPPQSQ